MTAFLLAVVLSLVPAAAPANATSQAQADRDAVHQAALDYIDALYLADPARVERSVHPQLTKRGFWKEPTASAYGQQTTMTYEQLVKLASTWNAKKTQDTSIKKIDVYEVLDQTASAKVTASWGIDYLQLAKYDGRWKIINILWQAHPSK